MINMIVLEILNRIEYLAMAVRIENKMQALFEVAEIVRKTTEVIF